MAGLIRRFLIAVRVITPEILRVLWLALRLVVTTVITFWTGVPRGVQNIVRTWMEGVWSRATSTEYDAFLRWTFTFVAYAAIVGGWISISYLTMFLLAKLF